MCLLAYLLESNIEDTLQALKEHLTFIQDGSKPSNSGVKSTRKL